MNYFHFNSIKVRLEQPTDANPGGGSGFQFHKGTIRTLRLSLKQVSVLNFNSIKVRLEPNFAQGLLAISAKFQFHKGTIRTVRQNHRAPHLHISIP